jgi:hypothetical protein
MKKCFVLTIIGLLGFLVGFSQSISGYVLDAQDFKKVPFVSIVIDGTTTGTTSDIDGYFKLTPSKYPVKLHFHTLGFFDTILVIESPQKLAVYINEKATELKAAVIVAGENPAIRIVQKAIDNRELNDPEKNYPFTYTTYSKMIFGPDFGNVEADLILSDSSTKNDSDFVQFQNTMDQHYLFITETVSERKFTPPSHSFENVIANRVSGLENPSFTMIATEFQPFSYYSDYVDIIGLKYLSPLARNSFNDYVFELKDSILENNDTIYTIYFQPKKGKTFNGLIGSMAINSNKYAIQYIKVKQANPSSNIQISVEQMSAYFDNKQWFPVQFNSNIIFKMEGTDNPNDIGLEFINATGKTYIRDIVIDATVAKKTFPNVELELDKNANTHSDSYWHSQRKEPLSKKEKNTYTHIDSIGKEVNLDAKMKVLEAISTGLLPIGPVSFELDKIIDYNEFEGIRLGLGLRTSDKISKHLSVGGYAGYGFTDVHWKYGGDLKWNIYQKNDITAGIKYQNDVTPSGGVDFFKNTAFDFRSYSNLYISRMDKLEGFQGYVTFRALGDFQNKLFFNSYSQSYQYPLVYSPNGDTSLTSKAAFQRAEIGWTFRFGLKEKYIRTFGKNVSLGTKFPYVWMRLAHGNEALGGTYTYSKVDARIKKTYLIKGLGKLGFQVEAGTTFGEVPSTLLHYARGMRVSGINLYIENAFNTMAPNEFLSTHYVTTHLHHSFGAFYKTPYSALELSVVTSAGWGSLENQEAHTGLAYRTMEKGFFESGLLFDNIFVMDALGLGAGVFYRYGAYSFAEVKDNFGFSFTFLYVLQ